MIAPKPPSWAINAGLPKPKEDEGFDDYVRRLGLDPEPLTEGLSERTMLLANSRLAACLVSEAPDYWRAYVDARRAPYRA